MDVIYILKLLRRHLWLLLIVPVLAGAAAFLFTLNMQRTYTSETTMATNFTTGEPVSFDGSQVSYFETNIRFTNAIETMNSPMVIDLVSYQLLQHDLQPGKTPFRTPEKVSISDEEKVKLGAIVRQKQENIEYLDPSLPDENLVLDLIKKFGYDAKTLTKNLSITRVNNSDFIKIYFWAENPLLAAFVVNSLCQQFIRFHNTILLTNSSESVSFFAALTKEKENILQERNERLNAFKRTHNIVDLTAESQSKITLITQYEQDKNTTIEELRNIQIELQYINASSDRNSSASDISKVVTETNKKILYLRSEIDKLSAQYVEKGSSDALLKEKIDHLNNELTIEMDIRGSIRGSGKSVSLEELEIRKRELELKERMATEKLEQVRNALAEQRRLVSSSVDKDADLANLQADVNIAAQEFKLAQEKYSAARNESLVVAKSGLKQIVAGRPPDEPESSKRFLMILLSAGASGALCLIYIFLSEVFNSSIKLPSRLEKFTKIRNVGIVNTLNTDISNLSQLLLASSSFKQARNEDEVYTFKQLLGKIRFATERSQAKILLVTSAREKVGKSYLIVGLAYSLSLINKKVLIIDTNFKNNSLTRLLIKNRNPRLLKRGNMGDDEPATETSQKTIVSPTFNTKIDIIGNDGGNHSPLESFKGGDFNKFIETVGSQYDYIMLEGAALNDFSDSHELCQYVDKIIAVFSADSEVTEADKDSLELLRSLSDKLIGTVLNKVEMSNLSS